MLVLRWLVVLVLALSACSDPDAASRPDPAATRPPAATTSPSTTGVLPTSSTSIPSTAPPTATTTAAPGPSLDELDLAAELVAEGFDQPVLVTTAPGDDRLFVVEQSGIVWALTQGERELYLDIRDLVLFGGERGLLGFAFHPRGEGTFFVHYSDASGDTEIARGTEDPRNGVGDPDSLQSVLRVDQPASNHNGGMIAFGPDGHLWIALGDGGGAGDRFGQGQRPDTLLGAILRIDVDAAEPYGIPPDNPFASGQGGAPEVWAYGLRNPWRFSFDGETIYVGDVGQNAIEEIDAVGTGAGGSNFGWPILEGTRCFAAPDCDASGLIAPVHEYPHPEGCSVIGGVVYRGQDLPALGGHYLYSDFCAGFLRSFRLEDGVAVDHRDWSDQVGDLGNVTSFGADGGGEVYLTVAEGRVYRLVPAG